MRNLVLNIKDERREMVLDNDKDSYLGGGRQFQDEDVNKNGTVEVSDLQLCVNVLLELDKDLLNVDRADVNNNGKAEISDLQQIVNEILGL